MADPRRLLDDLELYLADQRRDPVFEAAWQDLVRREQLYGSSWGPVLASYPETAAARRRRIQAKALRDGRTLTAMRRAYRSRMIARRRRV